MNSSVKKVVIEECIGRWDVRGETEGGYAREIRDFKHDRYDHARELACEWCKELGFSSYMVITFTSTPGLFHEEEIEAATGDVLASSEWKA